MGRSRFSSAFPPLGFSAEPFVRLGSDEIRNAAAALERAGFGAIWIGEGIGRDPFAFAPVLLSATEHIVVGTAIASIWTRDATAMVNGARTITEAWPDRFVLGLGASHPGLVSGRGHEYGPPLTAMGRYLDAMDAVLPYPDVGPRRAPPRLLAGTGPRMLELASRRADGAVPIHMPASYTRSARDVLGPEALLAIGVNIAVAADRTAARAAGDPLTRHYLAYDDHRRNIQRLGFRDEEMEGAGSDRVFDAMIIWGAPDDVASKLCEHFESGADHVYIRLLSGDPDVDRIQAAIDLCAQLRARGAVPNWSREQRDAR